ncbi:MbtH family NRPS accessory protein [Streptomyces sp. ICBB 8177]|uniref:MbtH family protein n=1 Tax=Streptomyces sp. ICBB 8177 TaxID=563922 RepID=UPI000D674881|nr:MbtH family NRPS accessory protein [Streptomyces sp. ICBB 8177]PWI44999.1 MbtH family protein [Streptomyces sp. ICBB 8177]
MVNALDDPSSRLVVVVNGEEQHSLWPDHCAVPAGWTVVHGPADRSACLAYVEAHWTDMRPLSLRLAVE